MKTEIIYFSKKIRKKRIFGSCGQVNSTPSALKSKFLLTFCKPLFSAMHFYICLKCFVKCWFPNFVHLKNILFIKKNMHSFSILQTDEM